MGGGWYIDKAAILTLTETDKNICLILPPFNRDAQRIVLPLKALRKALKDAVEELATRPSLWETDASFWDDESIDPLKMD